MPKFIFEANIAHYKGLLANETDPKRIEILGRLLAEEEAKLAEYHTQQQRPKDERCA
jgi:hypothetical protein